MYRATLVLALSLSLMGCASTKVTNLWKAPGFVPHEYTKILVVGLSDRDKTRETGRLVFERTMGDHLSKHGYEVVLGTDFLPPDAQNMPKEELRALVQNAGIDGAVTMGFKRLRKDDRYKGEDEYAIVGGSALGFYGTYSSWTYVKTGKTSDVPKDRVIVLEANFYDLKGRPGVMWRATTETKGPDDLYTFADEYAQRIIKVMSLQGVLKK